MANAVTKYDRPLLGGAMIDGRGCAIYLPGGKHRLLVGDSGAGKTSALFWMALGMNRTSLVFLDHKDGEISRKSAPLRSRLGSTHLLDPFHLCPDYRHAAFNPLRRLTKSNPNAIMAARRLAESLIVPGRGKDPFWENSARNLLTAILLHVGAAPSEQGRGTLKRARALLSQMVTEMNGDGDRPTIRRMIQEDQFGGLVAETIGFFVASSDRTASDVVATINADLGFLDIPQFEPVLGSSTFDFAELKQRVGTVYLTCGARMMHDARAWIRLVATSALDTLMEANGPVPVHIVIDEFPLLGAMKVIEIATSISRSANVFIHLVCQSLAQLEDTYGRSGFQALMANCAIKQFLGVGDMFTAREVSDLLGQTTVRTKSESHNRGTRGGSETESESFTGRSLMTPGEVMSMGRDEQIILATGEDPLRAWKMHYFDPAWAEGGGTDFAALLTPELQRDAPIWARPTLAPTHRRIGGAKP